MFLLYGVSFKMSLPLGFMLNCEDCVIWQGEYYDVAFEERMIDGDLVVDLGARSDHWYFIYVLS